MSVENETTTTTTKEVATTVETEVTLEIEPNGDDVVVVVAVGSNFRMFVLDDMDDNELVVALEKAPMSLLIMVVLD
jgi:hypothetical protein